VSETDENLPNNKRRKTIRIGAAAAGLGASLFTQAANMASNLILSPLRGGRPRTAASTNGRKPSPATNKVEKGEPELMQWIAQAEYEVQIDPYRGIQTLTTAAPQQNQQHKANDEPQQEQELTVEDLTQDTSQLKLTDKVGPWRRQCTFGDVGAAKNNDDNNDDGDENDDDIREVLDPDRDESTELVHAVCRSRCPTLIQWTEDAIKQRKKGNKKRKLTESAPLTGRRPPELDRRCACDYNPFCLVTLGGAMDDILHERARQLQDNEESDGGDDNAGDDDDNNDDDDVMVVDGNGNATAPAAAAAALPAAATTTTMPNWDWEDPKSRFYSPATREMLRKVRKSQYVDEQAVRYYLKDILQNLTAAMSLDEGIMQVRKQHEKLIFDNPLLDDTLGENQEKKLRLSVPPGIENLGATCYLNTQLQCLAQNRIFVEGIVSWRAPNNGTDDRMNSVLSLFQDLLVRMNAGAFATVNTLDFSNALGLDHYEQQDPNEFSRLFLDKMHDSFQQSGAAGGRTDLAELLPHLFRGVMMYETTCFTCKNKSGRTENFMDLNLPIVHPSNKGHSPKTGQQSMLDFLDQKKRDTDVQFCLDQYCHPESLDGENQYFCGQCGCKRDAQRALTFQKLPPVLNVQLSRYVFDRKTLMKKKLSDKVLLPLDLSVDAISKERKEGVVKHRYLLCAVMRHKGTSAYSGHYVGEAMDWLTGQWFEFNDEKVVWLKNGPSNSIDLNAEPTAELSTTTTSASITDGAKKRKSVTTAPSSGSQDAYNMYYVEESFLAQSALDGLRKQGSPKHADQELCVVDKIIKDRSGFYTNLSQ